MDSARRAQIAGLCRRLRLPLWFHSAAAGPNSAIDLLPMVGEPLVVPYPGVPGHAEALAALRAALTDIPIGGGPSGVSFDRGFVVYLAYDFAAVLESRVPLLQPTMAQPLAVLWRVDGVVEWRASADRPECRGIVDSAISAQLAVPPIEAALAPQVQLSEDDPAAFLDGVTRIHRYLRDGDVFQVNLSRAWRARAHPEIDPISLFVRLSERNPAPFAALMRVADFALLSSSPERLMRIDGDRISTRPIAGTRRRSPIESEDSALRAELDFDPKERAEHIMLIDLERNDLGRICRPGSIDVDELGVIESYAHVHHLVSNVQGRLRAGLSAWDAIAALFPGGTITGCPKVRCMQIIAELERCGRGAYTGSLGYISDSGNLDMNILIRSMTQRGADLEWRAGAGIVTDSVAQRELEETRAKAKGLLRAFDR
jgi:anthranilate synthase component 1